MQHQGLSTLSEMALLRVRESRTVLTRTGNAYMLRAMEMTTKGMTIKMMARGKRAVSGLVVPMV